MNGNAKKFLGTAAAVLVVMYALNKVAVFKPIKDLVSA